MGSVTQVLFDALAVLLIGAGLVGAVLPFLPGIPLIFAGLWLIAAVDEYQHVGWGWLGGIGGVAILGLALDFAAAALGARRVGASARAISGALIGTVVGLFLGIPGLLLGPFVGAVVGELSSGRSVPQSAHAGIATWIGLIFGTIAKLAASLVMIVVFATAWWWNSPR
jgi:uncharacterized protein YqgC (DUF456 family)